MTASAHPLQLGLSPVDPADWLAPQPGDGPLLAARAAIVAEQEAAVIGYLPQAEAAVRELAGVLAARGVASGGADDPRRMLAAVAVRRAEDLLILIDPPGYILGAGILCFPNRWRLPDKLGRAVTAIHGPVPDYAGPVSAQVDRFLERLRPGRVFARTGWGLASSDKLYLPRPVAPVTPGAGDCVLREEVQTFLKLPRTGAVVFSIRTHVVRWAEVAEQRRAAIAEAVRELSPAWKAYKSIGS